MQTRIEKDSLGELTIPADVYYGVQTHRDRLNPYVGYARAAEIAKVMEQKLREVFELRAMTEPGIHK